MEFNIHEIEKHQIKLEVVSELSKELHDLLFRKIRRSSKAYGELELLIDKLADKKFESEQYIKESFSSSQSKISQLKINTEALKNLFNLKKDFKCNTVSDTVSELIAYYKQDKLSYTWSKISLLGVPNSLETNFINSKFNICTSDNSEYKIIYLIDDLIIEDGIEYLDLRNYKPYNKFKSEYYSFSPNFTLADLDEFFKLLFK